jgi:hypothetical protein
VTLFDELMGIIGAVDGGERRLWVISREAPIAMKSLAARPQDIADIESLREIDR